MQTCLPEDLARASISLMVDGKNSKLNGPKTLLTAAFAIVTIAGATILLPPSQRPHHRVQLLTSNNASAIATYTFGTNQSLYFYKGTPMANQTVGKFISWLNMKSPRPLFRDLSVFKSIVNNLKPALFVY